MRRLALAALLAATPIASDALAQQSYGAYRAGGYNRFAVRTEALPAQRQFAGAIVLALPAEAPFYAGYTYYRRPLYAYPSDVRFPDPYYGYELAQVSPFPGGTCAITSTWNCLMAQEANIGLPCTCRSTYGPVVGVVTGP